MYQYYFASPEIVMREQNKADFNTVVKGGNVFIPPLVDSLNDLFGDDSDFPFEIEAGYRLEDASNPRLFGYADGELLLGYEHQAGELQNAPGERGWIAVSHDGGLTFEDMQSFSDAGVSHLGPGVLMPDGKTLRRYYPDFNQNCGIVSESSTDGGDTWKNNSGIRYSLKDEDCRMGVWTTVVTDEGGVVMFYNHDESWEETGEGVIYVRRIYSEPGDNGMNFELTDEDVMGYTHEDDTPIKWADPNAVVLPDGRIRLILMHQERGQPTPPLGRTGALYSFISDDEGETFEIEGKIFAWDDVEEFEVYSLNDPKILRLEDGHYRIFVAALIPLKGVDTNKQGLKMADFRWVMLSAISEKAD